MVWYEQMLYKEVPLFRKFQKDYLESMVWYEQMLYKAVPLLRKFQKDYLDLNLIRYLINQFKNVKPKTSLRRYSKFVESYFFKEKIQYLSFLIFL